MMKKAVPKEFKLFSMPDFGTGELAMQIAASVIKFKGQTPGPPSSPPGFGHTGMNLVKLPKEETVMVQEREKNKTGE